MSVRDEIINTAFSLFSKHGCHAVGIDLIADKAGVSRQTVYNHFEARDSLIMEVMRWRGDWWRNVFKSMIEEVGGTGPLNRVRCVSEIISDKLNAHEFDGCFFTSAAAEFPNPNDPANRIAQQNLDASRTLIEDLAKSAGLNEPALFAKRFAILIQGVVISKIIQQDAKSGQQLCELADMLIERHLLGG